MKGKLYVWLFGALTVLVVIGLSLLMRQYSNRIESTPSEERWKVVSTIHDISEDMLSERTLQPVWFGPPRIDVPDSLEQIVEKLSHNPSDEDTVAKAAIKAAQVGKWSDALGFYETWIKLNPEAINAQLGAIYALVNLGRVSEALQLLDTAKRRAAKNKQQMHYYCAVEGDVYFFLAMDAKHDAKDLYEKRLKEAEVAYTAAQKSGDFSARASIGLLRIALETGRLPDAQRILNDLYTKGVHNQREQALVAYYQGVLNERQGNLSEARNYYRSAIQADPPSFAVLK